MPTSYERLYREVQTAAAGLLSLGVKRGDHVGLISDNRKEWLLSDLGILSIGAADVPRGCDATSGELAYILGFSECRIVFAENENQVKKILSIKASLPSLSVLIVYDADFDRSTVTGIEILAFSDLLARGERFLSGDAAAVEREMDKGDGADLATIIFTSGTTGEPKGVMLSHKNFLHQVHEAPKLLTISSSDIWLCVLPVWHSFERIMQYIALGFASALAYSKPIGKIMLADCQKIRPTWMASVPRIWESIKSGVERNVQGEGGAKAVLFRFFVAVGGAHAYFMNMLRGVLPEWRPRVRALDVLCALPVLLILAPFKSLGELLVFKKIKAKLGGRFIAGISGGGALPAAVDTFFSAIGILVLEGYGLTETAPVLGVRKQSHPVPGTIGRAFPGTEIKIVGEDGAELPPGRKGLILARGPQIMLGYYRKPDLTRAIIDEQGWLNTGDLGMKTVHGEIKITGRAKDTIVLRGGENVEPGPIESKLRESPFIDQAVILGQDEKFLAALIVANTEAIEGYAKENSIPYIDQENLVTVPEIVDLINTEIQTAVNPKTGFKGFEMIFRFRLLAKPFEAGRELSAKQEIKRHVINELYKAEIKELFA